MRTAPVRSIWVMSLVVLALVAMVLVRPGDVLAQQATKFTVMVTDGGWVPDTVEVNQGTLVEIKFIWDHKSYPEEKHIIVVEGYNVESGQIDAHNKETTVKLVASKPGKFTFKCDLECDLHEFLQKGTLKVNAGAGGGEDLLTKTKLSIDPSGIAVKEGVVTLLAYLYDEKGQPVPKAKVTFFAEQSFTGLTGLAEIGDIRTGPTGQVKFVYRPTQIGTVKLTAKFEGMGIYAGSEQIVEIPSSRVFETEFGEGVTSGSGHSRELVELKDWAPVALISVVVIVWTAFAFALYQAWSVSRVQGGR